jgi:hypothetical protein
LGCVIFNRILWYYRDIKVNPTFLGFLKPSGGASKRTLYVLVGWTLNMPTGVDGETPPGFLLPVKEQVACMKDLMGELHKLSFFGIIIQNNFMNI